MVSQPLDLQHDRWQKTTAGGGSVPPISAPHPLKKNTHKKAPHNNKVFT